MSIGKIFKILITIVACIVIGGFILNTVLPNGVNGLVNTMEGAITDGTGVSFDLNGDGITDGDASTGANKDSGDDLDNDGVGVKGFN